MPSRNRGKPKLKLSDISRLPPTQEERDHLIKAVSSQAEPISVAILGAAIVEHELELQLRRHFPRADDAAWRALVTEMGPLNTFYAKIMIGSALRIYDDGTKHNLNIVRSIRNVFAHSKKLVAFENELIVAELKKIKDVAGSRRWFRTVRHTTLGPKEAYINLCLLLGAELIKRGNKATQARTRRWKRKAAKFSPFAQALLGSGNLPKGVSELSSRLFQHYQSGGPIPEVLARPQTRLAQMGARTDDNKGK